MAAVLVAVFALAGGALALSGVTTGVPAIDRLLEGATRDFADVPRGAPRPVFQPQRGSVSDTLKFQFRGHQYTAVGFRAADGSVRSALVEPQSNRANGGIGCIGASSLRRSLAQDPGRLSGGGGGRPTIANGFARAEVVSLALNGASGDGVVALSEAWRPGGQHGEPVRFFYLVTNREGGPRIPPCCQTAGASRRGSPT